METTHTHADAVVPVLRDLGGRSAMKPVLDELRRRHDLPLASAASLVLNSPHVEVVDMEVVLRDRDPADPFGHLLDLMQAYLDVTGDDRDLVRVVAAACTTTTLPSGDSPLWLMIVGAASSGKTEVLRYAAALPGAHFHDDLTPAGLLSGKPKRVDGQVVATIKSGVLTKLEGREDGLLVFGDFSTILSVATKNAGVRSELFAALRRIYDGRYSRVLHEADDIVWEGRVTALAACTNAIDRADAHNSEMGERWTHFRLRPRDGEARRRQSRRARQRGKGDRRRAAAAEFVRLVTEARDRLGTSLDLAVDVDAAIEDAALFATVARSYVPRSRWGKKEIDGVPDVEEPARLTEQLAALARGLVALGVAEPEVVRLVGRTALSSLPRERERVLRSIVASDTPLTQTGVRRSTGMHYDVVKRALDDLKELDVLAVDVLDPTEETVGYRLTDPADARWFGGGSLA